MEYWHKQDKPNPDLLWSLPEQKIGTVQIVGGNSSHFATEIKIAELLNTFNLKKVQLILPDSLKNKLPPLDNIIFTPANDSGSFDKSPELLAAHDTADATLILGDLSKNSTTAIAISDLIKESNHPIILTRDSIDLVATEISSLLEQSNLTILATFAQMQKVLRAAYYPKMLLLSMPLMQAIEVLHKFTLSFPCTIITFHQEQIIIARGGEVTTIPISTTEYSPISLVTGRLAAKLTALSAWLPNQAYQNAISAIHWDPTKPL